VPSMNPTGQMKAVYAVAQMINGFPKFDVMFKRDVEEIRNDIINNPFHKDFKYIKGIELDVTWLHLDYRNWDKLNEGLFLFGV